MKCWRKRMSVFRHSKRAWRNSKSWSANLPELRRNRRRSVSSKSSRIVENHPERDVAARAGSRHLELRGSQWCFSFFGIGSVVPCKDVVRDAVPGVMNSVEKQQQRCRRDTKQGFVLAGLCGE